MYICIYIYIYLCVCVYTCLYINPNAGDGGEEHFKWASEDSELDQTIHAAQLFAAEAAALGLSEVLPILNSH